jgi:hypothetical protein
MPITQFLGNSKFDPETRRIMGVAFEMARVALNVADRGDLANEVIAKRIIELAKAGELNPDVLCEGGGISRAAPVDARSWRPRNLSRCRTLAEVRILRFAICHELQIDLWRLLQQRLASGYRTTKSASSLCRSARASQSGSTSAGDKDSGEKSTAKELEAAVGRARSE